MLAKLRPRLRLRLQLQIPASIFIKKAFERFSIHTPFPFSPTPSVSTLPHNKRLCLALALWRFCCWLRPTPPLASGNMYRASGIWSTLLLLSPSPPCINHKNLSWHIALSIVFYSFLERCSSVFCGFSWPPPQQRPLCGSSFPFFLFFLSSLLLLLLFLLLLPLRFKYDLKPLTGCDPHLVLEGNSAAATSLRPPLDGCTAANRFTV